MATKSFYEDLVIDTPEAAERFTAMFEENRPYVAKGHKAKEADAGFLREVAEKHGCREM